MLLYHLRIAFKSLRRSLGFSAVVVGGIALGIGVASLFATIRYALAKDPIPQKSGVLYNVRLDNWDPAKPHPNKAGIPPQIAYQPLEAQEHAVSSRLDIGQLQKPHYVNALVQQYLLNKAQTASSGGGTDLTSLAVQGGGILA